jgi:hypothetical protein
LLGNGNGTFQEYEAVFPGYSLLAELSQLTLRIQLSALESVEVIERSPQTDVDASLGNSDNVATGREYARDPCSGMQRFL